MEHQYERSRTLDMPHGCHQDPQVFCNMTPADVSELAAQIGVIVKQSCRDEISGIVREEVSRCRCCTQRVSTSLERPALRKFSPAVGQTLCRLSWHLSQSTDIRPQVLHVVDPPGHPMVRLSSRCITGNHLAVYSNTPRREGCSVLRRRLNVSARRSADVNGRASRASSSIAGGLGPVCESMANSNVTSRSVITPVCYSPRP